MPENLARRLMTSRLNLVQTDQTAPLPSPPEPEQQALLELKTLFNASSPLQIEIDLLYDILSDVYTYEKDDSWHAAISTPLLVCRKECLAFLETISAPYVKDEADIVIHFGRGVCAKSEFGTALHSLSSVNSKCIELQTAKASAIEKINKLLSSEATPEMKAVMEQLYKEFDGKTSLPTNLMNVIVHLYKNERHTIPIQSFLHTLEDAKVFTILQAYDTLQKQDIAEFQETRRTVRVRAYQFVRFQDSCHLVSIN